jgi:hypothetical protein
MARGSCYELQTQMMLSCDLDYLSREDDIHGQINEVERVLSGLVTSRKEETGIENNGLGHFDHAATWPLLRS